MMKWLLVLVLVGLFGGEASAQAPNQQCVASAAASGTESAITIPALPCALTTNLLILAVKYTNTGSDVTLQPLGLPAQPIVNQSGQPILPGDLVAGGRALLNPDGFEWKLLNPATQTVVSGGLGEDLFSFGCKDDGTDQTSCINNAMTSYEGCVIVDPSPTGFYVAGTLVVPRCLVGSVFNPNNSTESFAYTSHINCNNQTGGPCVKVDRTGNNAVYISRLTFLGTDNGNASVSPSTNSYGIQWTGGYNLQLRDVQFANFGTCGYFGPTDSGGGNPISARVYGGYFSRCSKHYLVDDGVPELYFVGGRWGENGGTDYNSADDYLYATKTTNGGSGSGPNTIVLDSIHANGGAAGCAMRWGGFTGTGGVYEENKVDNSHFEFPDSGYTGSASRGLFCIDSTLPHFPGLMVSNSRFQVDGGTSNHPLFNISTSVPWDNDFMFVNDRLNGGAATLSVTNEVGGHGPSFVGDYFPSGMTFVAGDTSATMFLSNSTLGTFTVNGQWGSLVMTGNNGELVNNIVGNYYFSSSEFATSPTFVATGTTSFSIRPSDGTWPVDGKNWDFWEDPSSGNLYIRSLNDAYNSNAEWMYFTRGTGYSLVGGLVTVNPPINAANGYESEGHVGVSGTFAGSACTLTVTGGLVTGASC